MTSNETLITHFYTCFQNRDIKGMQDCYSDDAVFNDAVFGPLNATEVRGMWEMLIGGNKDMVVEFSEVKDVDSEAGTTTGHWDAFYTFSKTGNKVVNKIDSAFVIKDGKILEHTDSFHFHTWAKQALGLPGLLLGWTTFMQNKVRKGAAETLSSYLAKKAAKAAEPEVADAEVVPEPST